MEDDTDQGYQPDDQPTYPVEDNRSEDFPQTADQYGGAEAAPLGGADNTEGEGPAGGEAAPLGGADNTEGEGPAVGDEGFGYLETAPIDYEEGIAGQDSMSDVGALFRDAMATLYQKFGLGSNQADESTAPASTEQPAGYDGGEPTAQEGDQSLDNVAAGATPGGAARQPTPSEPTPPSDQPVTDDMATRLAKVSPELALPGGTSEDIKKGSEMGRDIAPGGKLEKGIEERGQAIKGAIAGQFMRYLSGVGAMSPDEMRAAEQQYGGNAGDQTDKKIATLQSMPPDQRPDYVHGLQQDYKGKVHGLAAVAFDQGNLKVAAQAMTAAMADIVDGNHVFFKPNDDGRSVSATVIDGKGNVTAHNLTTDQFGALIKGNAGQFDHVAENGINKTLDDLSKHPVGAGTPEAGAGTPEAGAGTPEAGAGTPEAGAGTPTPTPRPAGAPSGGTPAPGTPLPTARPAAAGPAAQAPAAQAPAAPAGRTTLNPQTMAERGRGGGAAGGQQRNDMAGYQVNPDGSRTPLPPGADITKMRPPPGGFLTKGPGYATLANGPQNGPQGNQQGGQQPARSAYDRAGGTKGYGAGDIRGPAGKNQRPGDTWSGRSNEAASGKFDIDRTKQSPQEKYGRDVRDPDGWPTGVPRGGAFTKDGKSYDQGGHTYDVGKDGLPLAQQGQPGYHPLASGPGQPRWNGMDRYEPQRGQLPEVIGRQPGGRGGASVEAAKIRGASAEKVAEIKADVARAQVAQREKTTETRAQTTRETNEQRAATAKMNADWRDKQINNQIRAIESREGQSARGNAIRTIDVMMNRGIELSPEMKKVQAGVINEAAQSIERRASQSAGGGAAAPATGGGGGGGWKQDSQGNYLSPSGQWYTKDGQPLKR